MDIREHNPAEASSQALNDAQSMMEKEKDIIDHYISLSQSGHHTVIPGEFIEVLEESLDIIQTGLTSGDCPKERVVAMQASLTNGKEALEWLKTNMPSDFLMEYAKLGKEMTGLNIGIYADDGRAFERNQHDIWVCARDGYGDKDQFVQILVSDEPTVLDIPKRITADDLQQVINFIKNHVEILRQFATDEIDHLAFYHTIAP